MRPDPPSKGMPVNFAGRPHNRNLLPDWLSVHSLWLLFQVDVYILLYVNDIYRCSEQLSFILFADDTNIFYQHKDINVLIETLNNEL